MTKDEEMLIDKLLDKLDNETKNTLIRLLMTHDKKDIWIQQVPIYYDWEWQGHVMARYIKDYKYCVGAKSDASEYKSPYTEEKMIELCQSVDKPMTYKEKFIEVFGYEPDTDKLESPCDMFDCTGARCAECKYGHMKWHWDDEYRER